LVYGDVNSVTAAALASAKLRIPVVHVEGGVRSDDLYNAEEINRRVTDQLSRLIFACTKTDYETLLRENFSAEGICLSGDLMKDSALLTMEQEGIESYAGGYVLATIHREENVESPDRLNGIVEGLIQSELEVIFPAHPRTLQRLDRGGMLDSLKNCPRIKLLEPQGYSDFLRLLAGANRVFTDSGGVRREAYILGKPVIVPIDIVWFPEIMECGWMVTVDPTPAEIVEKLQNFNPTSQRPPIFGDGNARIVIADRIIEEFD
jgi:UDP-N-acetylglucosamine 2-epimerase (non-hydrolysing)